MTFNLSPKPCAVLLYNPSDVASCSGNIGKAIEENHPKQKKKVFEHSGLLGSKEVDEGPLKGKRVEVVAQHPLSSWASSLSPQTQVTLGCGKPGLIWKRTATLPSICCQV
ncbi:hypothetical protein NPIL_297661 [Nephila pilipes]|uniref:Uncharacterized protein n=1 Tax=Nephila pilipes TaxID=299642 RepID=A0A8X6M842_NEPPI|nr:hypothetical protein NPIL_297661 [Nephila pilipes]